jgi:hypothetical protein
LDLLGVINRYCDHALSVELRPVSVLRTAKQLSTEGTNVIAHAQENKQETNWTLFSCTAIGISLSHDERTLSQSDSRPVVGASSGAYAVDSSQCKPRQDHDRDGETTTTITAMRGKPPPCSLQHRSDTRHFGTCPGP